MATTVGGGMMELGGELMKLSAEWKREQVERDYIQATTKLQVDLTNQINDFTLGLQKNSYEGLIDPRTREDVGKQQIDNFLQRHRDTAEIMKQKNPMLATAYEKMIGMADMHINQAYGTIRAEKQKESALAEYDRFSINQADAYSLAPDEQGRNGVVREHSAKLQEMVNSGFMRADQAVQAGQKFFLQVHGDYATKVIEGMSPALLGDMKAQNMILGELTNRIKYPSLTEGLVNNITHTFRERVFQMMNQSQAYDRYASENATTQILTDWAKNPKMFNTLEDVTKYATAKGLKLTSSDMLTLYHNIKQGATSDMNSVVSVLSSGQGWGSMMTSFKNLYYAGKLSNGDAEKYLNMCRAGQEHEKDRAYINPLADPRNHNWAHGFSVIASNAIDPATKNAAAAATTSFFDKIMQGKPPDIAFTESALENRLTVSPRAVPQLPLRFQYSADPAKGETPFHSQRLLQAALEKKEITRADYNKLTRQNKAITDLWGIEQQLIKRNQEQQKKAGKTVTGAPAFDLQGIDTLRIP